MRGGEGLAFFVEQRDFDDPGIDDLNNEKEPFISGTRRRARGMLEDDAGIRTRPIIESANTRSNITVL